MLRAIAGAQNSILRQNVFMLFKRVILLLLAAIIAMAVPVRAFADYVIPNIHTIAQIHTDGSLHVVEQRAFSPDEGYSVLKWNFTGLPGDAQITVGSIRYAPIDAEGAIVGDWAALPEAPFQSAWRSVLDAGAALTDEDIDLAMESASQDGSASVALPESGAWSLDERARTLYIFADLSADCLVECDYSAKNAVFIYDDIAELYWDYISPNYEAEMENVQVTVQLPVPDGIEAVPGQNVLAWGHGPAGSVDIAAAGTVEYSVEDVLPGQYAQAHIIFPQSWLNNVPREMKVANSGVRKDSAIAEEGRWTDTWSNQRINSLSLQIGVTAACFIVLAAGGVLFVLFSREKETAAASDACEGSAIPVQALMGGVPAIAGRAYRWNRKSMDDFVASVIDLSRRGALNIDRVCSASDMQSAKRENNPADAAFYPDISISITPKTKNVVSSDVDRETLRVLFDVFADGYQSLKWSDILSFARRFPDEFAEAMEGWQDRLSQDVASLELFDRGTSVVRKMLFAASAVVLAAAAVAWLLFHSSYGIWILLITAAMLCLMANYTQRRTFCGQAMAEGVAAIKEQVCMCGIEDASAAHNADGNASLYAECPDRQSDGDVPAGRALPYIVAGGFAEDAACCLDKDSTNLPIASNEAILWLSPVKGYGGRRIPCFADYASKTLFACVKAARR